MKLSYLFIIINKKKKKQLLKLLILKRKKNKFFKNTFFVFYSTLCKPFIVTLVSLSSLAYIYIYEI